MQNNTKLKLIKVKAEAGNVMTYVFETGGLSWLAGQYQTYFLPQAGDSEADNKHFFTISSAPSEGVIQISTRNTGSAFKKSLASLKPRDTIERRDIEGDFTWEEDPSPDVIFVAGGIGVTPFRSILLERHNKGKSLNATLLYFNRNDEIPFLKEFEDLASKHKEFILKPIIGQPISKETITQNANAHNKTIYLSGPEAMVEAVGTELKNVGYNVKQDWFPGYGDTNY